jgi:hypothetical protein
MVNPVKHTFLTLQTISVWEPLMRELGVSEVARSPWGFLTVFKQWGARLLPDKWVTKRDGFIARHMAQMVNNDEPLYDKLGRPTRRHLALIAWAFSPDPSGLRRAARNRRS